MSSGSRKKRQSVNQTVGGTLLGFEQQVHRGLPPAEGFVPHAPPDAPLAVPEVDLLTLELPDELAADDPWAGIEDELADMSDPWADYAAEAETVTADGGAEPAPPAQPARPRRRTTA